MEEDAMSKESFFNGLEELEQRLKKTGTAVLKKPWSFMHIREDLWKNIESGQSTVEDTLQFAEKMGIMMQGGSVTIGYLDNEDPEELAETKH